jgi:hypothetical protein
MLFEQASYILEISVFMQEQNKWRWDRKEQQDPGGLLNRAY